MFVLSFLGSIPYSNSPPHFPSWKSDGLIYLTIVTCGQVSSIALVKRGDVCHRLFLPSAHALLTCGRSIFCIFRFCAKSATANASLFFVHSLGSALMSRMVLNLRSWCRYEKNGGSPPELLPRLPLMIGRHISLPLSDPLVSPGRQMTAGTPGLTSWISTVLYDQSFYTADILDNSGHPTSVDVMHLDIEAPQRRRHRQSSFPLPSLHPMEEQITGRHITPPHIPLRDCNRTRNSIAPLDEVSCAGSVIDIR